MPVYQNNTSNTIVEEVRTKSGVNKKYIIPAGSSVSTEHILANVNLTKTADAPFYNPLSNNVHEVTSTGPGNDQTVSINYPSTKEISIFNNSVATVKVFLRSKSNTPPLYSYPNTDRIVSVSHNVDQLILEFSAAATVYVEERD